MAKKKTQKGYAKGQRKNLQKAVNKAPRQKVRQPLDGGAIIPVAGYS